MSDEPGSATGRASDPAVRTLLAAVLGWYGDESDTRGHDADLGWLHAVAHGGDALGELAAWHDAPAGPATAAADNSLRLARTLHPQLVLGVRSAPEGPVAHPAVRGDALRILGTALAEVHGFYGSPE